MFSTGQLSLRARGDCAGKDVCSAREGELLDELLDVLDKLLDELLDEQWSDLGSLHPLTKVVGTFGESPEEVIYHLNAFVAYCVIYIWLKQ